MGINKQEIKYITYALLFSFIWMVFVIPNLNALGLGNLSPVSEFLIFNIGVFFLLQVVFRAFATSTKFNIGASLGILAAANAWDILQPPFMVSPTGQLLTGPILSASSSDYVVGLLLGNLGLSGFILYTVTYTVVPIALFILAAKLIPNFMK